MLCDIFVWQPHYVPFQARVPPVPVTRLSADPGVSPPSRDLRLEENHRFAGSAFWSLDIPGTNYIEAEYQGRGKLHGVPNE